MGGLGSGNHYHWWRSGKKEVVEDCLDIDANRWMREGYLRAGVQALGSWRWTYRSGGGFTVNYDVDAGEEGCGSVRLWYSFVWRGTGQQESLNYRVGLTATRPHFGGLRWWFLCPLSVGGRPCKRRVGKLYLPPAARYFGCRRCHELTYTSCQEHDSRVSALRRNPALLDAIMANPQGASPGQLILALKASMPRRPRP
jgi:hypothetical protein